MRSEALAIAGDEALRHAAERRDRSAIERELKRLFDGHQGLVSLAVRESEDAPSVEVTRGWPLDARTENRFEVVRSLGAVRGGSETSRHAAPAAPGGAETSPHAAAAPGRSETSPDGSAASDDRADAPVVEDDEPAPGAELVAVFAADKARF